MAIFECYTRYLAMRAVVRNKISSAGSRKTERMILIILFTLCLAALSGTSSPTDIIKSKPWPSTQVSGGVDKLISDEKDGSVYFTLNNDIYKLDQKLSLIYSGPVSTSSKVNISSDNGQANPANKILMLVRKSNQDLLFSCWQTVDSALKCWLNKLTDLRASTPLLWSLDNKEFKIDSSDDMQVLVKPTDSSDFLFLTSRFKLVEASTAQVPFLPAITRFKMTKSPKFLLLEQKSVLQYRSSSSNSKLINEYILTFNHNHHTYIIINEITEPNTVTRFKENRNVNVRMAKICDNDIDLLSYTEISITCNSQNNIHAKSAYLDATKQEPTLHIIFEAIHEPTSRKSSDKSSLFCSYSLQLVEDLFNKAISDCNNGYETSNLLAKFSPPSIHPTLCSRNPAPPEEWCTSRTNPFIDGTSRRYNLRENEYITLSGFSSINFLYSTVQGPDQKSVLFLGTSSGHLTKMSFDEDFFYTINLNNNHIKDYRIGEKSIGNPDQDLLTGDSPDAKYVVANRSITAITRDGKINLLDIDACHYYTTCHACLTTRDPLECAWCGGGCSRRHTCDTASQSTLSCPPIISSFSPKKVPLSGSAKFIIKGENFGTSKGRLMVKLNNEECLVDRTSSTSETIECIAKPLDHSSNVSISVEVSDDSSYIYSNGSTVSREPLIYSRVKIFGLHPSSSPQSGGYLVSVYGENLDAGSNRSIYLGDSECDITYIHANRINCTTKPWHQQSNSNTTSIIYHPLKVFIDGLTQIIEPKLSFDGSNLSTNFIYTAEETTTSGHLQVKPIEESHESGQISYSFAFTIIVILAILSLVIFFLFKKEKFVLLRMKLSPESVSDTKVSFRNPDSHKFLQDGGSSINGLVKLNGSIMSNGYFGRPDQLEQDQPLMSSSLDKDMLSTLIQERILIDRKRLTLGHVLGSGQFGRVYKGFLVIEETGEHMAVAVKTLHNKSSWDDSLDNRAFLEEGLMMKDFKHENVLALIGVTFDSNDLPMVITPFMLYGDLRSYISDDANSPSVKELVDFGTQVAKGMAYLSGLKFVHRDLAARNCMLDENLVAKVADFGLSRDIYECDYFSDNKKTKLPVKWMAIESLEKSVYNTKTDVWSYGVLLWELLTRGIMPYPDVDNFDLFKYLKEGRRMLRPRYCPMMLYKIMLSCWDENPANRPTFDELVEQVPKMMTQLPKTDNEGQQKVSRDMTYCDVLK